MMSTRTWVLVLLSLVCFLYGDVNARMMSRHENSTPQAKPTVAIFDELKELFPDTPLENGARRLSFDVARGTIASAHVLIGHLDGARSIRFDVLDSSGRTVKEARWYRMIDVPVTENTGLDRCTEKFSGATNPFVIRRAPFRIFDPFGAVNSPLPVDSSTIALRLEIPVDSTVKPGTYPYSIRIGIDAQTEMLDFVVGVHRAVVPPTSRSTISYVNWLTLDNLCRDHAVEKWSEPFWEMVKKYAELMAKGRQNVFRFLWGEFFTFDSGGAIIEYRQDRLERYINTFLAAGMQTIHGGGFAGRKDWSSPDMLLAVGVPGGERIQATSEKGKRIISEMAIRLIRTMKQNGWEKQWLQSIFDEPTDEFVARYGELVALMREMNPDLQVIEPTMTTALSGVVNYWCPQVQEYQANQAFFDQRKAVGDKVWVYTCLAPGGPWLNRLCDQERLRQVYVGWACARFDLQGFLHWGLNFHSGKPFEELVRWHSETEFLPAGDSHIIYPRRDGPLSSHRFESHRIGMEDFELLSQLKSKNPARAQEIIAEVFQAFDRYSKDVAVYRSAKRSLLVALDGMIGD
jgi:DnaJ-domain-containing protein 1